jgi:hypothetical protein
MIIKKEYLKNKSRCKITFPAQKEVADGAKEMKFKIT